jgi:hypothetical protein
MSRQSANIARFAVVVSFIVAVLPAVLKAQPTTTGKPPAPPAGSAKSDRLTSDTKAKLREATGNGTASNAQQLKQAVKRAESDTAPSPRFDSDYSACGYLTKPHVRPDGGGLNAHKGGQVLCHQTRLMHCLAGYWRDLGPCTSYGNFPQAWQFEGSDPPGMMQPGGSPDAGGSGSVRNPDDPREPEGPEGGGTGGGLIGTSPQSQQLESEMKQLREREAELNRQRGQQTEGNSLTQPGALQGQPGARRRPDPAQCAQLRQFITQADLAIKQLRDYSRSVRSDGQLSTDVRDGVNTTQSQRNQAQAMLNQLGC